MPPAKTLFTGAELQRARDYVREEPGFTAPFMAWELKIPLEQAKALTSRLFKDGYVEMIEPPSRPYAAVYAHKVPRHVLEASGDPRIYHEDQEPPPADLAVQRGHVVPHTRSRGSTGKPGEDRKRQQRGVRIRRGRNGT